VWDEIFDGNLMAPMVMACFAVPQLRVVGGGSIVNIGSVAGMQTSGSVGYGTAKGAVVPLTRDMAMALGPDHTRVNCVNPRPFAHAPCSQAGRRPRAPRAAQPAQHAGDRGDRVGCGLGRLVFRRQRVAFYTGQSIVDGGVTSVLAIPQVLRTGYAALAPPEGR
jgi:NAD(P)-dependent dehydrogenase (short-subunit alcohol dehydrogenase family)